MPSSFLCHFSQKNCWKFHICSAIAAMNRDEAEAAHHAAFLDKQERVFHRRQQVVCLCASFSFVVYSQLYVCIVNPATATKQMYNVGLGEVCISWKNLSAGKMWLQLQRSCGIWGASSQAQRRFEETPDLQPGQWPSCLHVTGTFLPPCQPNAFLSAFMTCHTGRMRSSNGKPEGLVWTRRGAQG